MDPARNISLRVWPNRLVTGRGSVAALPEIMADLGGRRALVICGRTVASGALLRRVKAALGERCCGIVDTVASHSPLPAVERTVEIVASTGADVLISVGGGSAIDAGKGTALLHATQGVLAPYAIRYDRVGGMERGLLPGATLPHIAIPTTTGSASEVMPTAGIRDPERHQKMLFWDDALTPSVALLDPEMTVATGPFLTATSGMTAVARCVEALYSADRNPLSEGLALHALRLLSRNLPATVETPSDLAGRADCQIACAMSGIASMNAMVSLVHALGHIFGGRYALQHGVSHTILLPSAMRRLLPVIGDRQKLVLEAMGGSARNSADEAGMAAADLLEAMIARLPLKRRLRDIGVAAEDLPEIAAAATSDYMMANLPLPMSVAEIEALLRAAW